MSAENQKNPPPPAPGTIKSNTLTPGPAPQGKRLSTPLIVLLVAVMGAILGLWLKKSHPAETVGPRGGLGTNPVPVIAGSVERKDVPIFLEGLGTVQAFNTVTVRTRVDGQVVRVRFVEGQEVHRGDLLAEIDPAPYQAVLDQNTAKKAQDEAQLTVAQITLKRDEELLASKILSQQEYDTQKAQVQQLQATVEADQAAMNSASVNLGYTTITSPLDGRTGIRQVDQGNIVHANDSNGLVVITQVRPISVVFTLPEQNLRQIQEHLGDGAQPTVYALDRDNRTMLGEGKLAVIDNEIDTTTGTLRLKATFPNEDSRLWPGQFVNVRLLLTTRKGATVVPASVVQRGPDGTFVFVLSNDVALVRPVKVSSIEQSVALIDQGLEPGERVVVDGQYKLQSGQKVKASVPGERGSGGRPANANANGPETPTPAL